VSLVELRGNVRPGNVHLAGPRCTTVRKKQARLPVIRDERAIISNLCLTTGSVGAWTVCVHETAPRICSAVQHILKCSLLRAITVKATTLEHCVPRYLCTGHLVCYQIPSQNARQRVQSIVATSGSTFARMHWRSKVTTGGFSCTNNVFVHWMGHSTLTAWMDHRKLPEILYEHVPAMSSSRTVRTLMDESDEQAEFCYATNHPITSTSSAECHLPISVVRSRRELCARKGLEDIRACAEGKHRRGVNTRPLLHVRC
jgi:hypothetical protein